MDEHQGVREIPEIVWKILFACYSGGEYPQLLTENLTLTTAPQALKASPGHSETSHPTVYPFFFTSLDPTLIFCLPWNYRHNHYVDLVLLSLFIYIPLPGILVLCYFPPFTGSFHFSYSPEPSAGRARQTAVQNAIPLSAFPSHVSFLSWSLDPIPPHHPSFHKLQPRRRKHGGPLQLSQQGSPASLLSFLQCETAQRKR